MAISGVKFNILQVISTMLFCLMLTSFVINFELRNYVLLKFLGKLSLGIYLYHLILITFFLNKLDLWYIELMVMVGSTILSVFADFIQKILNRRVL